MKSVRVGNMYEYAGNYLFGQPLTTPGHTLQAGDLVRVVNVSGGSKRGVFRNVEDAGGVVHFVHIHCLRRPTR